VHTPVTLAQMLPTGSPDCLVAPCPLRGKNLAEGEEFTARAARGRRRSSVAKTSPWLLRAKNSSLSPLRLISTQLR